MGKRKPIVLLFQKMAIPLFMEILKLAVHTFIGLMTIPQTEDPELRGCSKRCMGTGPVIGEN